MKPRALCSLSFAAGLLALGGCVAPTGPVEVTRFHLPEAASATRGTISVTPAPVSAGTTPDAGGLEFRTWALAIERELQKVGYTVLPAGSAASQQALLSVERQSFRPERARGPVSVGLGGSTGSFGSGVGLGLGIDLSGRPPEQVATEMRLVIRASAGARTVWEGRATFAVRASSPLARTDLGAAKMAEALFKDWPGRSGETIQVK